MTIIRQNERQTVHRFENGYGASVISDGYGGNEGLFEVGVIKFNDRGSFRLSYSTPIADDTIGYLNQSEVDEILSKIEAMTEVDVTGETRRRVLGRIAKKKAEIEALEASIAEIGDTK